MKKRKNTNGPRLFGAALLITLLFCIVSGVKGQGRGNSISGHVMGIDRQPVRDIDVELMDDLSRTIARTRTNGGGYYSFSGVGQGRFIVKVLPFGTDYEEQENSVEIVNFTQQNASGGTQTSGFIDEQSDFSLRLRRGVTLANSTAIFVQEVPPEAKKLYDKALAAVDSKRMPEAQEHLRAALNVFPRYYAALERLGTEYIREGKPQTYRAAEILFGIAVEVNPRGYKSWYGLAYARYSLGKHADGLTAALKAVELNSFSPEAMFLAGALMRHTKKFEDAEKHLLKAKELSKDTIAQVHWELALLYGNNLERYGDAARELKQFLKGRPDAKDADNINKLIADFEAKALKPKTTQ